MLRELEDGAGGSVHQVGHGEDERFDVALEQGPDAHRARLVGREDRGVGETLAAELAGGLSQGDDDGMGRRVGRLPDTVVRPGDHRLVDDCHGCNGALVRGQRLLRSAEGLPMYSS